MASELVGHVEDAHGWTTQVRRSPDGTVIIKSPLVAVHDAASLAAYRELLDRAAMPGQDGRRDGHPLVESALAIARAEQEAVDRDE